MSSRSLLLIAGALLALSACAPQTVVNVPTLAVPPSESPTVLMTTAESATAVPSPTETVPGVTQTATVAPLQPAFTASTSPSLTATDMSPFATTAPPTVTPSLTITKTITPTPSQTLTPTLDVGGFSALADLAARITVQPPDVRYGPGTATALWIIGDQLAGTAQAARPTASATVPVSASLVAIVPGATVGQPGLGTLPPPPGGGSGTCSAPPGGALGALLASDAALSAQLGCALGAPIQTAGAVQPFERGLMVYRAAQTPGAPGTIEALSSDSRFSRYADTWISGVDPDSGGLTPPSGLIEPIRGFGKIWRGDGALAARIGWALTGEQGVTLTIQPFERGVAVYVPTQNAIYVLADDGPGTAAGNWRQVNGGF